MGILLTVLYFECWLEGNLGEREREREREREYDKLTQHFLNLSSFPKIRQSCNSPVYRSNVLHLLEGERLPLLLLLFPCSGQS